MTLVPTQHYLQTHDTNHTIAYVLIVYFTLIVIAIVFSAGRQ